jgi:hypothetical protein
LEKVWEVVGGSEHLLQLKCGERVGEAEKIGAALLLSTEQGALSSSLARMAPMPWRLSLNAVVARRVPPNPGRLQGPEDEWATLDNQDVYFSGEEAVKNGIANEIGEFSPPRGSRIYSV